MQIPGYTDIGRPPQAGDIWVIETPAGTRSMDHTRLISQFGGGGAGGGAGITKVFVTSTPGQTEVAAPGISSAGFSEAWRGTIPLAQYMAAGAIPAGYYRVDDATQKVQFGGAALGTEQVLILYDPTGTWKKTYHTATAGQTVIPVPGLSLSTFSVVWASMQPLPEYQGADPVPAGSYRANYLANTITLGTGAVLNQVFFIMHK